MATAYEQLLEATIQHLEDLKTRGTRHIAVTPETLRALAQPAGVVRTPAVARPASAPAPTPRRPAAVAAPVSLIAALATPEPESPSATAAPIETVALTSEAKAAAFANLRERALACVKCPNLASTRKNVVFGVGNPDAQLLFVGEAPGADEDKQGEPFVGPAGQLLTKIIQAMGLQRSDVYIANILKCRPDVPAGSWGNRKPTPEEMRTCIPYLHEQIELIRPRVMVALGGTAVEGLLGKPVAITKLRGAWQTYRGIQFMPTFHPSYVLRAEDGADRGLGAKRQVWEDILQVMERLEMPISDKQRKFFK